MAEPCCCNCDEPFSDGEKPVIEYDATLGVHFLVHDYCVQQREVDAAWEASQPREYDGPDTWEEARGER